MSTAQHIAIIGGGPAGLIAAETLARAGKAVTVYDRMPSVGRKFLMAGRGGLNLTHSDPFEKLITRYGTATPHLLAALEAFPPEALVAWCEELGQPTFTGSSGRIFPKTFKASPLLRAWLKRLGELGVTFKTQHRWTGWNNDQLTFETPDGPLSVQADATVLALGGASWPRLGSDGHWSALLEQRGVKLQPFKAANCGLHISWSDIFKTKFAGQPLKSIALRYQDTTIPGEMMITATGLEGTPAYTVAAALRNALPAPIAIDLRPGLSLADLTAKLSVPRKRQSLSTFLQKAAGLSPAAIGLVQEIVHSSKTEETPAALARLIKAVPLSVTGTAGLERAISSAGGIDFSSLDTYLMLCAVPGVFAAGEMLDWEAPTGGYLLQASFSTGISAARGVLNWLETKKGPLK